LLFSSFQFDAPGNIKHFLQLRTKWYRRTFIELFCAKNQLLIETV